MDNKIKVLYIAGWGRSGSTILSNILGQIDGFFSVGEIRFIWERNALQNTYCGCGSLFNDCTTWSEIIDSAFGGLDQIDSEAMVRICENETRTRHLLRLALSKRELKVSESLREYLDNLKKLYQAISITTGGKVIVDSSKYPSYGAILGLIPEIDLSILHLVRDSRAVSYSWRKKKLQKNQTGSEYMLQIHPLTSSILWDIWNVSTEVFWKNSNQYLFLTYEDFIANPQENLRQIIEMVGEKPDLAPTISNNRVMINPQHTLSGNPVRFETGPVELKLDQTWRSEANPFDSYLTTTFTWPLLLRYGYL